MLLVNKFSNPKYNLFRRNCLVLFKVNIKTLSLEKGFESELFLMASKPIP